MYISQYTGIYLSKNSSICTLKIWACFVCYTSIICLKARPNLVWCSLGMVGRIMPLKDVLIFRTCEYDKLPRKGQLMFQMKLRLLIGR